MIDYGELHLAPVVKTYNAKNGQFLKGNIPHNKGKKWSDYASKRAQKRMAKGWKNLVKYRPKERPDTAGRCRKGIIAIFENGTWRMYDSGRLASDILQMERGNINRCCRFNQERHVNKKTGKINTDHKYMGIRFYFESDAIWTTKITT